MLTKRNMTKTKEMRVFTGEWQGYKDRKGKRRVRREVPLPATPRFKVLLYTMKDGTPVHTVCSNGEAVNIKRRIKRGNVL